jgi:hypothetical protein
MRTVWLVAGLFLIGLLVWYISTPGGPGALDSRRSAGDKQQASRTEAAGGGKTHGGLLDPGGPIDAVKPAPTGATTPAPRPVETIAARAVLRDPQEVQTKIDVNGVSSPWLPVGGEFKEWRVVSIGDTAVVVTRREETKTLRFRSAGR